MKIKKNVFLLTVCLISAIVATNISIQATSTKSFSIFLKNIDAIANSGEGTGPTVKEFSCFVGTKGDPKHTYLKIEKYCGDCISARILYQTGTGRCKNFE